MVFGSDPDPDPLKKISDQKHCKKCISGRYRYPIFPSSSAALILCEGKWERGIWQKVGRLRFLKSFKLTCYTGNDSLLDELGLKVKKYRLKCIPELFSAFKFNWQHVGPTYICQKSLINIIISSYCYGIWLLVTLSEKRCLHKKFI